MRTFMTMLLAAGIASAANRTGTFTGTITETMCKKDHLSMKLGPDPKCIVECVNKYNGKYALSDGANLYVLSDQNKPAQFAGKRVKITGTLFEKTKILKADSIEALK